MNKVKWIGAWCLIAVAAVGIVLLAYRAGFVVGSDMAVRDNAADATAKDESFS